MFLRLFTNLSHIDSSFFPKRNISKSPLAASLLAGPKKDPKKEITWTLLNILGRA